MLSASSGDVIVQLVRAVEPPTSSATKLEVTSNYIEQRNREEILRSDDLEVTENTLAALILWENSD